MIFQMNEGVPGCYDPGQQGSQLLRVRVNRRRGVHDEVDI